MKSVMKHQFSEVPKAEIPRSAFNRTHAHKTTFDAGYLIPFYVDEALPGDTFNLNATLFARLATPIFPIMDNMYMDTHYFAVPIRLVWSNFQKMMGEQVDPGDSIDYSVPIVTAHTPVALSLWDYFGLPIDAGFTYSHSALFSRAYNLIYNEWYRDENLQDSVVVDKDDGPDTASDYVLLRRGKRHDYFTSCLPWPQKGDDAVTLPLTGNAPVTGIGMRNQTYAQSATTSYESGQTSTVSYATAKQITGDDYLDIEQEGVTGYPAIYANLSAVSAATINALRLAFQMQKLLERDARGGTRYTEIIKSHFGVTSPDARLQRPEYLGGSSSPVNITTVPQTSQTDTTAQGTLAGFGTVSSMGQNGFTKSFTEHCIIIGLVSVRADLTYQQGLPKMFTRSTRYDFYWPALAHIGEQAVLNGEIYFQDNATYDDDVFGYQERYAEYRYYPSKITGQFRSTHATSLDAWHLSQEFGSLPSLNTTFIQETPPVDRVIADSDDPHFIFDSFIQLKCVRPMPVYSVPGLIDHF